ncbi:MAG TPA: hypothetical protein VHY22_11315 [Chthoniobacteraceae bacterium]|jgi:hypothetical protein|nr:hypothetical protein [Chthoniobacteraceae bacterium]
MFKQLVESSRKKLAKATAQAAPQAESKQVALRKKPEFEPLESRVLFSGIGNGFNKKSVTFTDAWGDTVLVKLIGPGKFDITLDGGAPNHADIENITINGNASSKSVLDVYVKPHHLTLSQASKGGQTIYGDPNRVIYATTTAQQIFTPGFVQIGGIYATTNLRGITLNGADFQNIDVSGSIGTGTTTFHGATHSLAGGIAVDIGDTQFRSGLLNDPVQAIGFGNISVTGSVDSLILRGRTDTPSSNNMVGSITIGGSLTSIDARYSNLLAPISATSIGSMFVNNILANVTTTGAIGQLDADNLVASVTAGGAIGNVVLTGSLTGTLDGGTIGGFSVNGNFTGLLEATGSIAGPVVINSGTAFTGTIESLTGSVGLTGGILLSQASTPFSGQVSAPGGSIGSVTAGFFSDADIIASGGIGAITSNATSATVTSGIVNSVFQAGTGGIGNITSVASITNSQFEAVGGAIGNVTVTQGGISGVVIGGSTSILATGIGSITANLNIEGTSAIASGTIQSITSIAGFIGGSSNTAQFIKPGIVVSADIGGAFNIDGVIAIQGGQSGPKADVFIAGSIGSITALSDISGNVITATAGNIGPITSHEGRIAFDSVSATGNIGNIYANSQDATFAFDSAGNVLESSGGSITGTPGLLGNTYSLVPSASAIDHSSFIAGGTIGSITARSSAVGGYFPAGTSSGSPVYMANRAIDSSVFTAGTSIGSVYALAANTTYHPAYAFAYESKIYTGRTGLDAAIFNSNFLVTDAPVDTVAIGPVKAIANGGPGIDYSTFHAETGNIGNIYGRSMSNRGIFESTISADSGNVGVVKGVSLNGNGSPSHPLGYSGGLDYVTVNAGPNGTGSIAGIYGKSAQSHGVNRVIATAGSGGIGYITGVSTSATFGMNGIYESAFKTTGIVGNVTGMSASGSGIGATYVIGKSIGSITGTTTGYGSGISGSGFYAQHGIASITGSATSHTGANGISYSYFNANTANDGNGSIGNITGTSAGARNSYGIYASGFYAGNGIGNITGSATNFYGLGGISKSTFDADQTLTGLGSIGVIKGTTVGYGDGIFNSGFYSGAGIGNIYGLATGARSGSGISGSTFNADDAHLFTSTIGNITGQSLNNSGGSTSGIVDSHFTAGYQISNILGTTTGNGSHSYGILGSDFFANAGLSTEANGKGAIGSITGTAVAYGAVNGYFAGIAASIVSAGSGPGSTGSIGVIYGGAKATGPEAIHAYGIEGTKFVAGSASGVITSAKGYALAQGSSGSGFAVYSAGIGTSGFYAGTGSGGVGNGSIGNVTGTAISSAAFGNAHASGITGTVISAGGAGKGTIGNVGGYATATDHTGAAAWGIVGSEIQAGVLSGGKGYISSITASATANSQNTALAIGMSLSGVWAGYTYGNLGNVSVTAKATGEGNSYAWGIFGGSFGGTPSYASTLPGFYTLKAGSGVDGGVGVMGSIYSMATATANTGNAKAYGMQFTTIAAGYTAGFIGGNIKATAGAYSGAGYAAASGIDFSIIASGLGAGGTGLMADVTATATAISATKSASAFGIVDSEVASGLYHGTIANVTGTAYAKVKGASYFRGESARAYGIDGSSIYAGISGNYGKIIDGVTGTAKATIFSNSADPAYTSTATAYGISGDTRIYAAANDTASPADHGLGSIGAVYGRGQAYAYGLQVSAYAGGILNSNITASNGANGFGGIASVSGKAIAKADSTTFNASSSAYGLSNVHVSAGTGLSSTGFIGGAIYGSGTAESYAPGGYAKASAAGIKGSSVYAGTGTYASTGYINGPIAGLGTATAHGAVARSYSAGIADSTIKAGLKTGSIGNITGTAISRAVSYYGSATAIATGMKTVDIYAGFGSLGFGTIANIIGTGNAYANADGGVGGAYATGTGIDPSNIFAGSAISYVPVVVKPAIGGYVNVIAGSGMVASITGTGYASAVSTGVDTQATATAYGIDGLNVYLGTAISNTGIAVAGSGFVTNGITGNATAYATSANVGGNGTATAVGIKDLYVSNANASGVGYAKGGIGSIGSLNAHVKAAVHATNSAIVTDGGLYDVTLSVGNATAGPAYNDIAFGGNGTIGAIYQKQTATATATNPYGFASATTGPINGLLLSAGNASGGAAYAGKGYIAANTTITGIAGAYATGYSTIAESAGLTAINAAAGNAAGIYYATGGTGVIGQLVGTATSIATSTKTVGAGSVSSNAEAYGIDGVVMYAGNAEILNGKASAPSIGGSGSLGGFVGTAIATATSKPSSLFNGEATARAHGILDVYAYAGNAVNAGTGPAKSFYGSIGTQGPTVGKATAFAYTKGGGAAKSYAYAYGIKALSLNAGNAATYGGGKAIAKQAVASISGVKAYGSATAYAYGKNDPNARAIGTGMVYFTLRAGNAFVEYGGTSGAYGAGSLNGTGSATIAGIYASAVAKATAIGTSPVSAYAGAAGMLYGTKTPISHYGLVQAGDAYSNGVAYGGKGYIGTTYGVTANSKATATATSNNNGAATAVALSGGIVDVTLSAGTAGSYGYDSNAYGGTGNIAVLSGIRGTAGAYANATGAASYARSQAYGITFLNAYAGDAYGARAIAGPGTIGAVVAKGTAKSLAYGTGATVAKATGVGIKYASISAATAGSPTESYGSAGAIGYISGTGAATARAEFYTGASATAYAAGIKETFVYSGDAFGYNDAIAGAGSIGKVTGSGTALAYGYTSEATSYGIDPSTFSAGAAIARGVFGFAAGGGYSTIAGIYGTALSKGYGSYYTGGYASASAKGINNVIASVGKAYGSTYVPEPRAYVAVAGAGSIGPVMGKGSAYAGAFRAYAGSYGINDSSFTAGVALGSPSDPFRGAQGAFGVIGDIYGSAKSIANGFPFDNGGYATAKTAAGISSTNFEVDYATGHDASAGYAGGSSIGTVTAKGYAKGNAYSVLAGSNVVGLTSTKFLAGYAVGSGTVIAGSGSIAALGAIYGSGVSKAYSPFPFYGTVIHNLGGVGMRNVSIRAGVANAGYSNGDRAYGAPGTIGNITGIGTTISRTGNGGYVQASGSEGIGVGVTVAAGSAYGFNVADAGAGVIGNIYGEAVAQAGFFVTGRAIAAGGGTRGIDAMNVSAGYASASLLSVYYSAHGGSGSIGNITGKAYAYAQASYSIFSSGHAYAPALGVYGSAFKIGGATAARAYAGTASAGNLAGYAKSETAAYTARAVAAGIQSTSIIAGVAHGSTAINAVADAAYSTIGNITGKAYASARGIEVYGSAYGRAYASGINSSTIEAGNAYGNHANALNTGLTNTVGTIYGYGHSVASGYTATAHADGIVNLTVRAGYVTNGNGKLYAGAAQAAIGLAGVYGKAIASATSPQDAFLFTTNPNTFAAAYGISGLDILMGTAVAGTSKGNAGYGATGTIGAVKGVASATATTTKGAVEAAYATGLEYAVFAAGSASGSTAHAGIGDSIGNIYGKGTATADLGAYAPTTSAKATAFGVRDVSALIGSAESPLFTGPAIGGSSTVGNIYGHAYAYATASATTGKATSLAYGIQDMTVYAGSASGLPSTAGVSTIHNIDGTAKGVATGAGAHVKALGIDPSKFYSGTVYSYYGESVVQNVLPLIPGNTAAASSIGNVTGTAYGSATGENNGGAYSLVLGMFTVGLDAGVPVSGAGGAAAKGTVGAIYGSAKAYAVGTGTGSYIAAATGVGFLRVDAGYYNHQSTGSSITSLKGYAISSNAKAGTAVAGINSPAVGLGHIYLYSGGSIGAITGTSTQGTGAGFTPGYGAGIYNTHAVAITSIGDIKATNTGTGANMRGIQKSHFTAGTEIDGVYVKTAGAGDSIYGSSFRAYNTGANLGIGYVKAYVPSGDAKTVGIVNTAFTTNGSIGAITVTGSVFSTSNAYTSGFFAGDLLDGTTVNAGLAVTADATIGAVSITGYFGADLVASVSPTNTSYFGRNNTDTSTGTIGAVSISYPNPTAISGTANFGIEAATLGTVTWGGASVPDTGSGTIINDGNAVGVRVRAI